MSFRETFSLKKAALLFGLFAILSFSLLYNSYKFYNIDLVTQDSKRYLSMAIAPGSHEIGNPFKYRVLTPALVHLGKHLPAYNTDITSAVTGDEKQHFFYFLAVNYGFVLLFATLMAFYCVAYYPISWPLAIVGSLAYLISFTTISTQYIPHVDAGAALFIVMAIIARREESMPLFLAVSLLGVLQKESVIIVVGLYLMTQWVASAFTSRDWVWALALVPAALLFLGIKTAFPATGYEALYQPSAYLHNLLHFFSPAAFNQDFMLQVMLAFLPLWVAFAGHAYLAKIKQAKLDYPMSELLLLPALFLFVKVIGMAPGNIGRFLGFGYMVYLPYMLCVAAQIAQGLSSSKGVTTLRP